MEKLAQHLKELVMGRPRNKRRSGDWALKALSLCLGVFLWYFVVGEDQVDINVFVPIEILNLPQDLVIANQYKKELEVSIRGPRSLIQELRNKNITRPVNLSNAKPGPVVIRNDENSIPFPRGISVLRVQPTNITLVLDRLIRKDFPIHPVTEGSPKPGYTLKRITVSPDHLTVTGPKSILDSEMALKTDIINLDGLQRSTTLQVQLNLSPQFLDLIGETVVTARLEVEETLLTKTVRGIPVNVREAKKPVTTVPKTVAVIASIPENLVRNTPELAMLFRASVNVADLQVPGTAKVNVIGVNVPDHAPIRIISVKPSSVRIMPQEKSRSTAGKKSSR